MRQRVFLLLLCGFLILASVPVLAEDQELPLTHWVYNAMAELQTAGLIPEYPQQWIAANHPLTRHELAIFVRAALLQLDSPEGKDQITLDTIPRLALADLVSEFAVELRALGMTAAADPVDSEQSAFVDLDLLLPISAQASLTAPGPEILAGSSLSALGDYRVDLTTSGTYASQSLAVPLNDFRSRVGNLISLAGEVLGVEWSLDLNSGGPSAASWLSTRSSLLEDLTDLTGSDGLSVGAPLGANFDASSFVDLDQAKLTVDHLFLDLNTVVELGNRLEMFSGLSLDYGPLSPTSDGLESSFTAGLGYELGDELYLFAQYRLENPLDLAGQHLQSATLGFGIGDIGLLLLGLQTLSFSDLNGLELTGEFIYRF